MVQTIVHVYLYTAIYRTSHLFGDKVCGAFCCFSGMVSFSSAASTALHFLLSWDGLQYNFSLPSDLQKKKKKSVLKQNTHFALFSFYCGL